MKKRLLIPIILFCFFMIPKNAFAANNSANISLYDKDWNLLGQCLNNSVCTVHSADEMNKVKIVQLGIKTSIISGLKYRLDTTFWIGGFGTIHPTFNNPNLNYGNGGNRAYTQEYFNINWTRNQPLNSQMQTTFTRSFGYASNFTAVANSDYVLFEFHLNNDISFGGIQLNVFNFGPVGTSTNDAISNSTNVIIQNQNENTEEIKQKQEETTNAVKENTEVQKNIFQKILELPITILNAIIDGLKKLFVPSDDFFENFINDFKDNFLAKLGFLAYPFELIADILGRYMNISTNPIINIPTINEPFSGTPIIQATSFNIKEVFETGEIGNFYNIYMSFVSVIIIFMFLNFAIHKFNEFVKNRGGSSG